MDVDFEWIGQQIQQRRLQAQATEKIRALHNVKTLQQLRACVQQLETWLDSVPAHREAYRVVDATIKTDLKPRAKEGGSAGEDTQPVSAQLQAAILTAREALRGRTQT